MGVAACHILEKRLEWAHNKNKKQNKTIKNFVLHHRAFNAPPRRSAGTNMLLSSASLASSVSSCIRRAAARSESFSAAGSGSGCGCGCGSGSGSSSDSGSGLRSFSPFSAAPAARRTSPHAGLPKPLPRGPPYGPLSPLAGRHRSRSPPRGAPHGH
jgi:hypothetical protein